MARWMYTALSGFTAPDADGHVYPIGSYVVVDENDIATAHNTMLTGSVAVQYTDAVGTTQSKFTTSCRDDCQDYACDVTYVTGN